MSAAEHPTTRPGRSEVDLAADLCVKLLEDGVVRRDALGVAALARSLDITASEIKAAWVRHGRYGWTRPRRVSTEATEIRTATRMPIYRRPWKDEPASQLCRTCEQDQPIDQFGVASAGRRKKVCRSCETAKARQRYLSVELQAELGNVLRFVAHDDDACVGETCPECDNPIEARQSVIVRAHRFEHSKCLPVEHAAGDKGNHGAQPSRSSFHTDRCPGGESQGSSNAAG